MFSDRDYRPLARTDEPGGETAWFGSGGIKSDINGIAIRVRAKTACDLLGRRIRGLLCGFILHRKGSYPDNLLRGSWIEPGPGR
jgi:hypothetical protein